MISKSRAGGRGWYCLLMLMGGRLVFGSNSSEWIIKGIDTTVGMLHVSSVVSNALDKISVEMHTTFVLALLKITKKWGPTLSNPTHCRNILNEPSKWNSSFGDICRRLFSETMLQHTKHWRCSIKLAIQWYSNFSKHFDQVASSEIGRERAPEPLFD